jgi:riboflavin kinase
LEKIDRISQKYYHVLKAIAQRKGEDRYLRITSGELATLLGMSQQNASRLILEMDHSGIIERKISGRRQEISITEPGLDLLFEEFADLSQLLGTGKESTIRGTVQSGLGEGRYYVAKKPYLIQFNEKLGMIPYPGTLNVKVLTEDEKSLRHIRAMKGIIIEGFNSDDRTFGAVKAFPCSIKEIQCALIFPYRSIYRDVMEIISHEFLRQKLDLKDGDKVEISFSSV